MGVRTAFQSKWMAHPRWRSRICRHSGEDAQPQPRCFSSLPGILGPGDFGEGDCAASDHTALLSPEFLSRLRPWISTPRCLMSKSEFGKPRPPLSRPIRNPRQNGPYFIPGHAGAHNERRQQERVVVPLGANPVPANRRNVAATSLPKSAASPVEFACPAVTYPVVCVRRDVPGVRRGVQRGALLLPLQFFFFFCLLIRSRSARSKR